MQIMRVLGILYLFLNLVFSLSVWATDLPVSLDSPIPSSSESFQSDLSFQQSPVLVIGEALPNYFVPSRTVIRTVTHFFESHSVLENYSGLSATCRSMGRNYRKSAFVIDVGLPTLLLIFPHHYFT